MVDACLQYKNTCTLLHDNLNKLQGQENPSVEVLSEFVCLSACVHLIQTFNKCFARYHTPRHTYHKFQMIEDCMQCFAHLKKYNCKAQQQCKRVRDNTRQVSNFSSCWIFWIKNPFFHHILLLDHSAQYVFLNLISCDAAMEHQPSWRRS